jgi:GntR family transcriptional regulator/MocR family aminotransferase
MAHNNADYQLMWHQLLPTPERNGATLQSQLRTRLANAILDGHLAAGVQLPSTRELSLMLSISRSTAVLAYERLVEDGYIENRPRSGYFVSHRYLSISGAKKDQSSPSVSDEVLWDQRFKGIRTETKWLNKPHDWQRYRYPFLYGQTDPTLFPIADWRECSRQALDVTSIRGWSPDAIDSDDESLLDQLIRRVLPRRGIAANRDEILLTVGAQQALYLLAELLMDTDTPVAIEDPGYMDARNIFLRRGARLTTLKVDAEGVVPDDAILKGCKYLYCTPSHQCPTGVTLTTERRMALLRWANAEDGVVIEDDYDAETQYVGQPLPALKAIDQNGRVIYVGSLSKSLSPGLRLGYVVAPAPVIKQLRILRRLMIRHPPTNNQLTAALFIEHGHYDRLLRRLKDVLAERADILYNACCNHLPQIDLIAPHGGSAIWARLPAEINTSLLKQAAMTKSILIESGETFFLDENPPTNYLRLGYSSIASDRIEPGIRALAEMLQPRLMRTTS